MGSPGSNPSSFIGAGFAVLLVMQVEHLPTPVSLSWRSGYGELPRLHLQVYSGHWRTWLDQLTDPELTAELVDDTWHLHAEGLLALAPATRVHLVTVTDSYEAAAG